MSQFLREEASPTEVFQLRGSVLHDCFFATFSSTIVRQRLLFALHRFSWAPSHSNASADRAIHSGIHRYLQEFPTGGLYRGKNFVFDSRVAVGPREHCIDNKTKQDSKREGRPIVAGGSNGEDVVGRCTECQRPHDAYDHNRGRCHRCRALVLVCPNCLDAAENESNLGAQSQAKGSNESTRQAQQTDQNEVSHAKNPLSNIGKDERPLIFCRRHGSWSRLVKQALANVGSEVDSFKQKLEMLEKQVSALVR